ncbi:hypothetical protein [Mycobacterium sp. ACS4331]|uniref:hypothetical protein n=1 Tax=Mycobacterium sp. ACS4331 TaxID=1834121 RepID=UPI0007FFC005|nr:hypothetical protein [Mycobacterium sp. ACS4331]OBF12519.1 hypothetical protein A5727_17880 [Mycobacterium sp. ACS4331]
MSLRSLAGAALAVCALLLTVPVASADPTPTVTQIPERPAPSDLETFTDDPAIVDARPLAIESWSRQPDGAAISVHFTSGTPQCHGVHAEVAETADLVAVKLRSGTRAEAVGRACIEIAVFGELTVNLDTPVADRAVVSIT